MASFRELRSPADRRDAHDSVNAYAYSQLIHGYHALGTGNKPPTVMNDCFHLKDRRSAS